MDPIISYLFKKFYMTKFRPWIPQNSKFHHYRKQLFNGFWIKARVKISSNNDLKSFINMKFPPKNIYYSISKWSIPEKIGPKNLNNRCLGTNLIFDLDIIQNLFDLDEFEDKKNIILELKNFLKHQFGFSKFMYLWTGNKGFHLYVLDYDFSDFYDKNIKRSIKNPIEFGNIKKIELSNRSYISEILTEEKFNVDFNVVNDLMRIVRLPRTLHGSTSLQSILVESESEFLNLSLSDSFVMNDDYQLKLFFIKNVPEVNFKDFNLGPFKKGDIKSVSSKIGCLLILKKYAKLVSKPSEININDLEPYVWLENKIRWCKDCNIPILETKTCPKCSNPTFLVRLSGVGDVRPAFNINKSRIRHVIDSQYGINTGIKLIPDDKIILLNRVPRVKSREIEIIIDGHIIGKIKFNNDSLKFEFVPTIEGADRLYQIRTGNWVKIKKTIKLKKFQFLSSDDIVKSHIENSENRLIFIIYRNTVVSLGKIINSITHSKYIQVINVKKRLKKNILKGGQTWDQVIATNQDIINKYEDETILFIQSIKNLYKDLKITVPFSGGKDSLVTLALVQRAIDDFTVNYVKSEIEFPETNKYVNECIDELNLNEKYLELYEPKNIKDLSNLLGPPQIDNRWCCKIYKFGPTNKLYREHFPDGCISFVGLRSYESNNRTLNYRLNVNPWLPNALSVHPIYDWNALMIWLYIFKHKLPINPIYEKFGRERVGCWICPHQDLSNFELLKLDHEHLWKYLIEILENYIERFNLGYEFITYGIWRWVNPPKKVKNWAISKHIPQSSFNDLKNRDTKILQILNENKISNDKYIISGYIENFKNIDEFLNTLHILGKIERNNTLDVVEIKSNNGYLKISSSGEFELIANNNDNVKKLFDNLKFTLYRVRSCIGCLNCISLCEYGAIYQKLSELPPLIDTKKCIHCIKCNIWCPVVRFTYVY
ncbi:MAG: phosphoadenosine phosphosulfate reductase domain-containing protein [Candidatus Helarchaeota archaeon]